MQHKSQQDGGHSVQLTWISQKWQELRQECRTFPWREASVRIIADLISVNSSIVSAFVVWYFVYKEILKTPHPEALALHFRSFVSAYGLFWSFLALVVFQQQGFYTRTRGYAHRYKALVVLRAVTLFVLVLVFSDYFIYRGELFPRGVALLSWLFLLLTVGGSRFVKHFFFDLFPRQPKHLPRSPEQILVVGGAGYLGSALVPMLLKHGYRVRVLDSLLFGKVSLQRIEKDSNFELVVGD